MAAKEPKRKAQLRRDISKVRTRAREAGPRARAMPADLLDVTSSRAGSAAVAAPNQWARPQGASNVHAATPTIRSAMPVPPPPGASMAELQRASVESSAWRVQETQGLLAAMQGAGGAPTVDYGGETWHVDPVMVASNLAIEQQALANNQAIAAGQPVPFPNAGSERSGSGRRNRD